jgi:hypothetical protein
MLESIFLSFSIIFSYVGHLPFRLSSIEVIFKIMFSSTRVDLQMLESFAHFTTSLDGRPGGRPGAGGNKIKTYSAQLSWDWG